ncbi:hypothetical protein PR202_gb05231 [Eleusine coracana subsp. coracana]|uniref:Uncharacterized protein n=1 Tax=Eleusine coracana subsp. coracana TaxID=191504 RepID=A0AAV5E7E0_ELECO|nr:hypothetical protein PR202_gb05231 [Eleusine coracana subsp. coracana]
MDIAPPPASPSSAVTPSSLPAPDLIPRQTAHSRPRPHPLTDGVPLPRTSSLAAAPFFIKSDDLRSCLPSSSSPTTSVVASLQHRALAFLHLADSSFGLPSSGGRR